MADAATVVFRTSSPRTGDASFLELPLCSTLRTSRQGAASVRLSTLSTPSGIPWRIERSSSEAAEQTTAIRCSTRKRAELPGAFEAQFG